MWELDQKESWCWRIDALNCSAGEDSGESFTPQGDQAQSILKEISPEYTFKGLTLNLKLQYFGHLIWRTNFLEKTLMLGKIEGRKRGQQRMRGDNSGYITD